MRLTFTLQSAYTGSTYVAGPFNISGRTSGGVNYQLSTGVTKTQLTTGHTVDTIYETITGGTIVSTGSCSTSVNWVISAPVVQTVTLEVYGKDVRTSPRNTLVYYTKNAGSVIYLTTLSPLSQSCSLIGSITGLTLNDVIVIGTVQTYPILGANSSTCPTLTGTAIEYTRTISITSGTDYVAFSTNSSVSV